MCVVERREGSAGPPGRATACLQHHRARAACSAAAAAACGSACTPRQGQLPMRSVLRGSRCTDASAEALGPIHSQPRPLLHHPIRSRPPTAAAAARTCSNHAPLRRPTHPPQVVLAYSGGLDTSVILKWLQDTYECEVRRLGGCWALGVSRGVQGGRGQGCRPRHGKGDIGAVQAGASRAHACGAAPPSQPCSGATLATHLRPYTASRRRRWSPSPLTWARARSWSPRARRPRRCVWWSLPGCTENQLLLLPLLLLTVMRGCWHLSGDGERCCCCGGGGAACTHAAPHPPGPCYASLPSLHSYPLPPSMLAHTCEPRQAGVSEIYIDDLREEFVRDFVFPMFRCGPVPVVFGVARHRLLRSNSRACLTAARCRCPVPPVPQGQLHVRGRVPAGNLHRAPAHRQAPDRDRQGGAAGGGG